MFELFFKEMCGSGNMNGQYFGGMALLILLFLSMIGKNNSLAISVSGLLFLHLLSQMGGGFEKISQSALIFLEKHGLNIGVMVLMMGLLAPFALGQLEASATTAIFKSYKGIIGILAGMLVAIFGARGGYLLEIEPILTTSVVIGTIFGIIIFKGYPVGPLIGSGIAYFMIYIIEILMKK